MKKNVCKVIGCLVSLVMVTFMFTGCSSNNTKDATNKNTVEQSENKNESNDKKEETEYKSIFSKAKTFQLNIPKTWVELDNNHEDTFISALSESKTDYVTVTKEQKADLSDKVTIDSYMDTLIDSWFEDLSKVKKSDIKELDINGQKARQIQIDDNVRTFYIITIIETDTSYYQVIMTTSPSGLEDHKGEFEKIISSFKEI